MYNGFAQAVKTRHATSLRSSRDGVHSVSPSCASLTRGYRHLTPSELYSAVQVHDIKEASKNNGLFQPLIRININNNNESSSFFKYLVVAVCLFSRRAYTTSM